MKFRRRIVKYLLKLDAGLGNKINHVWININAHIRLHRKQAMKSLFFILLPNFGSLSLLYFFFNPLMEIIRLKLFLRN